jgi:sporulation protein YlmC with PRC-barrel domain
MFDRKMLNGMEALMNLNCSRERVRLVRLSDAKPLLPEPLWHLQNRKVLDANREGIGRVDDLLVDVDSMKVRFLQVTSGGFLGLHEMKYLVPVDAIMSLSEDSILVNQTLQHVVDVPDYDPAVGEENYYEDIYGYYGYVPFWGTGYVEPDFSPALSEH